MKYVESPNTNGHKHALKPCYLLDFTNSTEYVSGNKILQSSKIIANISQKLICEEKYSQLSYYVETQAILFINVTRKISVLICVLNMT